MATCFQDESWRPWNNCSDTQQNPPIDENSCRATKAFLCLAICFVWIGWIWDRRHKFLDVETGGIMGHVTVGIIYRIIRGNYTFDDSNIVENIGDSLCLLFRWNLDGYRDVDFHG